MSGAKPSPAPGVEPSGNDPSMEDILASIRRILSEEEPSSPPAPSPEPGPEPAAAAAEKPDDVLVLDSSMLVAEEPPAPVVTEPEPEPEPLAPAKLLAPETEAAASSLVGNLVRTLATERALQVHRGGPTIEEMVREELRPLLKQWLDANLPGLVERLVQAEIERVVHRVVP